MVICILSFLFTHRPSVSQLPAITSTTTLNPSSRGPDWTSPLFRQLFSATSTQPSCSYTKMLQHWSAMLCTQANLIPIPTSEHTLLLLAAHLTLSGLAHTSIKVYFSAIGNLHPAAITVHITKPLHHVWSKSFIALRESNQ